MYAYCEKVYIFFRIKNRDNLILSSLGMGKREREYTKIEQETNKKKKHEHKIAKKSQQTWVGDPKYKIGSCSNKYANNLATL